MTTPGDLSVIISILADDQATGLLAALPEQVQQVVREVDAILKQGFGGQAGFDRFNEQLQASQLRAEQLVAAVETLSQAFEASFDIGGAVGARLTAQFETMREAVAALHVELAGTTIPEPLTSREAQLNRVLNASDAGAIAAANSTGSFALLNNTYGGLPDKTAFQADIAQRRAVIADLNNELKNGSIEASDKSAIAEAKGQIQALTAEVRNLEAAYLAASRSAGLLGAAGAEGTGAGALVSGLVGGVRGADSPRLALAQAELEMRSRIVSSLQETAQVQQLTADEAARLEAQTLSALRAEIGAREQVLRLTEQQEAAQVKAAATGGGGGGFFSGFAAGAVGGHGEERGALNAENIGFQIGQVSKYVLLFEAFIKGQEAIRKVVEETKLYQEGLVHLEIALSSITNANERLELSQAQVNQLITTGAQAGVSAGESLTIAARAIQAYHTEIQSSSDANRVAAESVQAVTQGAVVAADKYVDVQTRLIAVTSEFNLGSEGQVRVLDAATNANRRFGTSIKDVLDGLSQVSGLAVESGFSVEQLANAIALVSSRTGLNGSAVAGDLKRIIGGEGAPAFQRAIGAVGVDTNQSFAQELEQLGGKFNSLTQAQQENLVTTLGGRRAAEALIPLLQEIGDYNAANAYSLANLGATQNEFNKQQETLAGLLRQIDGAAKQLAVDLGQSGVGAGFGLLLASVVPVIRLLDDGVKIFNDLPSPIRTTTFAVLELAAALRLLEATGVGGAASRLGGFFTGLPGRIRTIGATDALGYEASLGYGAAEGATLGSRAGNLGRGALETLNGVGPLLALVGGAVLVDGATRARDRLHEVSDQLNSIASTKGDANSLFDKAAQLSQTIKRQEAPGFGNNLQIGFETLLGGDPADSFKRAVDQRNELLAEASRAQAEASAQHTPTFSSATDVTDYVKGLDAAGVGAATQVQQLNRALNELTGASQAAAVAASHVKDGVSIGVGPANFANNLIQDALGGISKQGIRERANPSLTQQILTSIPLVGLPAALGEKDTRAFELDGRTKDNINQTIRGFVSKTDGILTVADQEQLAKIIAGQIKDPFKRDTFVQAIKDALVADQNPGDLRAALASKNTDTISAVIAANIKATQQSIADLNARGASTGDVLQQSQVNVSSLLGNASQLSAAKFTVPDSLRQAILVAQKDAFDAFAARINELKAIAEATANPAEKKAIEQSAAQILTRANSLDPRLLPTGIKDFTDAQRAVANAVLAQSRGVINETDRLVLLGSTAERAMYAAAKEILDNAAALLSIAANDPVGNLITGGLAGPIGKAETTRGQKLLQTLLTQLNKDLHLSNPSAQPSIDLSAAKSGAGAGGATDTAAQIAAARNAANVFPDAKVEEAAAAIRTAAADLAAQKKNTVAFYNALKQYRDAQYAYTQAVLEAQHVARETRIDLTNPLAVAQEALTTAQAKLRSDQSKHAPSDVINNDRLAVEQAANALANTKFQQNLDTVKTNFDLERITQTQYLAYLDAQRDHLLAIHKRTYQQQQELNEIDQLLQEASKQLQGQFNLGDIKLPTPFEVRRQIAGGTAAAVGSTQYVSINISGADTGKVTSLLTSLIGSSAFGRATVTTTKV